MLANPSLTIKAGTDLTGGGSVALGGSATLNLDTTKVPTLGATSNTFTGTITASTLNASGAVVGGNVVANGTLFADYATTNSGSFAPGLSLGQANSAAITSKQTAGGNENGMDFWTDFTDRMSITSLGAVGIGTANPYTRLHLREDFGGAFIPMLTLMNGGGGTGAGVTIDFDSYDPTPTNDPSARIRSIDDGNFSDSLAFYTKLPSSASNHLIEQMRLTDYGTLVVDSSGNNTGAIGPGFATGGTGLIFGGTGSGEGIASCRSTSCAGDQFGLDFYTNATSRMSIFNNGDMAILGCTSWSNGDHQGNCPSDARLKTNIQPFPNVLDKLTQLQPVHFDWKSSAPPELRGGSGRQYGFIAQDVEKVFPEMVSMGEDGYRRVNYGQLPYLLLQGVRELKANNDTLRAEVQLQRKQNQQARAEIAKLHRGAAETAARLNRLDRSSAAKDAQIAAMHSEIDQLRKAQQQMAVLLARFAPPQSDGAKLQAEVRPAANSLRDRP
jgi:Chaperone of endosialidase